MSKNKKNNKPAKPILLELQKYKRPLWKTKTAYVGLLMIAAAIVQVVFDGDWQGAMTKFLAGAALIAGRDALAKLEK